MKRFGRKGNGLRDPEARLRDERLTPSDDLIQGLARTTGGRRREPVRRARVALALAVTSLVLVTAVAMGGLPAPVNVARNVLNFNETSSKDGNEAKTPAHNEFEEKLTICHRPPRNPDGGQTQTLPRPAAEAHLRNHPDDSLGPCSPARRGNR